MRLPVVENHVKVIIFLVAFEKVFEKKKVPFILQKPAAINVATWY